MCPRKCGIPTAQPGVRRIVAHGKGAITRRPGLIVVQQRQRKDMDLWWTPNRAEFFNGMQRRKKV